VNKAAQSRGPNKTNVSSYPKAMKLRMNFDEKEI